MLVTAAALVVAAAIALAVVERTGAQRSGLLSAAPNSAAVIDAKSNRLVMDIRVGNGPTSIATGDGTVWATSEQEPSVLRIDPGSKSVQHIPVGGDPSGIAVGADAVWVTNPLDGTVMRIDPERIGIVQTIQVGVTPNGIVFARGVLWVTSADDRSLNKIDPVSGRVVKRIRTGAVGRGVAVGDGAVWVTDESSRSVMRIDPASGRVVTTVPVGNGPTGIAFGAGSVWVANSLDGTVMRIDPDTNTVTATAYVGEGLNSITADAAAVWASSESSRSIVRIDPATGDVAERIPIGNRPKGLAVSGNQVWVAVQPSGRGHRGGRLIIADGGPAGSIDPSFTNWAGTMRTSARPTMVSSTSRVEAGVRARRSSPTSRRRCQRSRTARQRMHSSSAGASATRTGRSSRPVTSCGRSSDPSAGARGAAQNFPLLVGADACKRRPRRCDLSEGVRTDDATGTIVFHLRRPDRDFLGSLTGWAPIPPGTPNRDLGRRPLPSTGPYKIKSYVPERVLTLVRNPYFRVWSRVATPEGFPDTIVIRLSSDARAPGAKGRLEGGGAWAGRPRLHYTGHATRGARGTLPVTRCTGIQNRRRSSFSSTRAFRPSTTFASGAQSTSPSTALPLQGRWEGRSSPGDVPAPPSGHGWFPALLPLHRGSGSDRRVEGARPDAGASPCRCLRHQGHEGDGLDGPQLLGPRRAQRGLHSRETGLPRETQGRQEFGRPRCDGGAEKTDGLQAGMAGYYGIPGILRPCHR